MATQCMKRTARYIALAKLLILNKAATAACDAQDGLADGPIGNPPA